MKFIHSNAPKTEIGKLLGTENTKEQLERIKALTSARVISFLLHIDQRYGSIRIRILGAELTYGDARALLLKAIEELQRQEDEENRKRAVAEAMKPATPEATPTPS